MTTDNWTRRSSIGLRKRQMLRTHEHGRDAAPNRAMQGIPDHGFLEEARKLENLYKETKGPLKPAGAIGGKPGIQQRDLDPILSGTRALFESQIDRLVKRWGLSGRKADAFRERAKAYIADCVAQQEEKAEMPAEELNGDAGLSVKKQAKTLAACIKELVDERRLVGHSRTLKLRKDVTAKDKKVETLSNRDLAILSKIDESIIEKLLLGVWPEAKTNPDDAKTRLDDLLESLEVHPEMPEYNRAMDLLSEKIRNPTSSFFKR